MVNGEFISLGDVFWQAVAGVRHVALVVAFLLYLVRLLVFQLAGEPNLLSALESMSWMLAILGYGSLYLNEASVSLTYFSKAVYPIYIFHMPSAVLRFVLSPSLISAGNPKTDYAADRNLGSQPVDLRICDPTIQVDPAIVRYETASCLIFTPPVPTEVPLFFEQYLSRSAPAHRKKGVTPGRMATSRVSMESSETNC